MKQQSSPRHQPLPDALLERYILGELPLESMEPIRRRLEDDAELRARLQALRQSDRDILGRFPSLSSLPRSAAAAQGSFRPAERPEPRMGRARTAPERFFGLMERLVPGRGFPWFRAALPAFASLVILAVVVDRRGGSSAPDGGSSQGTSYATETAAEPGIRLKGREAGLAIYRKSGTGIELLPPMSQARPGDTLQIFYQSFQDLHGMIFSVDGRGSVTLHLPEEAGSAARLVKGGLNPLPHAYLLDQAPRLERFFLVTSPEAFSADSLLAALRPALLPVRPLPDSLEGLPPGFRQYSYTLRKPDGSLSRENGSKGRDGAGKGIGR